MKVWSRGGAQTISSVLAFAVRQTSQVQHQKTRLENLCYHQLKELNTRLIKPSEADNGRVGDDRTVNGVTYSTDIPHYVIGSPNACTANKKRNGLNDSDYINVYLPGTGSSPPVSSCLLKSIATATPSIIQSTTENPISDSDVSSSTSIQTPTIGLSYAFLDQLDAERNRRCSTLHNTRPGDNNDTDNELTNANHDDNSDKSCYSDNDDCSRIAECLAKQHQDAIYGGDYGDKLGFWCQVHERDSISARLGLLLRFLHDSFPHEGWDRFYTYTITSKETHTHGHDNNQNNYDNSGRQNNDGNFDDSETIPIPVWEKIMLIGHSQGGGHAAYLAQTTKLHGASLLSAPQDECICVSANSDGQEDINPSTGERPKFWIDEPFATYAITAMAHGDDTIDMEPSTNVIQDNWRRMAQTGTTSWSYSTTTPSKIPSSSSNKTVFHDSIQMVDFGFGLSKNDEFNDNHDTDGTSDYEDEKCACLSACCSSPLLTFLDPASTSSCKRKGHCSTSTDDSTPLETGVGDSRETVCTYSIKVWPALAQIPSYHHCCEDDNL